MKAISLVALVAGTFFAQSLCAAVLTDANPCQPLANALSVAFPGAPSTVEAGKPLSLTLHVTVANTSELSTWNDVRVMTMVQNSIPGSSILSYELATLVEHGTPRIGADVSLTALVPGNFGGEYQVAASLFATTKAGVWCGMNLPLASHYVISVSNDPSKVDITPPVVADVRLGRDVYTPGETLRIEFQASAGSAICTKELADAHRCPGLWDVELDSADGQHEVHPENAYVEAVQGHPGTFEVTVNLPHDMPLGEYVLSIVDVQDVYGNSAADLPESERQKITIAAQDDAYTYERRYVVGDTYGFELTVATTVDGTLTDASDGTSAHRVVGADGTLPFPHETIIFDHLTVTPAGGADQDKSAVAKALPGYSVSLAGVAAGDPRALALPSLAGLDPAVIELITDLQTFFVAISHQTGSGNVHRVGDQYTVPTPAHPSWANGTSVLVGEDCIQWTVDLVNLKHNTASYQTTYFPPSTRCLTAPAAFMAEPVAGAGTPNNWQQVVKDGDSYDAMWGHEGFTVNSVVDRQTGKIIFGTMTNTVVTRTRTGCDGALTHCTGDIGPASTLTRSLTLKPRNNAPTP